MILLRQRLLVDSNVQGALLRRVALYSGAATLYFAVILVTGEFARAENEPISETIARCLDEIIFWLPGLAMMAPIMIYDVLKLSNRFSGPIYRLRRSIADLADGKEVPPLSFRDDDYWVDMAEIFNHLRDEVISLRRGGDKSSEMSETDSESVAETEEELVEV